MGLRQEAQIITNPDVSILRKFEIEKARCVVPGRELHRFWRAEKSSVVRTYCLCDKGARILGSIDIYSPLNFSSAPKVEVLELERGRLEPLSLNGEEALGKIPDWLKKITYVGNWWVMPGARGRQLGTKLFRESIEDFTSRHSEKPLVFFGVIHEDVLAAVVPQNVKILDFHGDNYRNFRYVYQVEEALSLIPLPKANRQSKKIVSKETVFRLPGERGTSVILGKKGDEVQFAVLFECEKQGFPYYDADLIPVPAGGKNPLVAQPVVLINPKLDFEDILPLFHQIVALTEGHMWVNIFQIKDFNRTIPIREAQKQQPFYYNMREIDAETGFYAFQRDTHYPFIVA